MKVILDKPSFLGICICFYVFLVRAHPQSLSKSNFETTGPQRCLKRPAMDLVHSWPRPRGREKNAGFQIYQGKWYIYLHLVDFYGKCREIYHTWMVWEWWSWISGWWQLKYFLFSSRTLGKMNPFWLLHIFQMGWFNHQLALLNATNY